MKGIEKMLKRWKRLCAAMMTASIAIGAVMPGVEVRAEEAEVAQTDKLTYKQAEEIQNTYEDDKGLKLCVVSDTHYYPLDYVKDCEDYNTYVGGDPKMLAESGSIIDSAIEMIKKNQPDLVLISGDLTKDGEKLGHQHMAEKLQKIEDETDTEVFVINGNHDIYNYQDACTFENGSKEKAPTTTPKEFKEIYKNFGYNSEYEAQYFTPKEGKQAGGLSYSVTFGDYVIIGIDSGRYSPDADTGMDMNEHITAGRIDPDLLPWIVEQVSNAKKNGKTPIGLMHHGLVPHFSKEAELLSEYVVDDWQTMAGTIVYGPTRLIENHKVNSAVIEGTKTRLVRYAEGANIRLKGYTLPENAFDNGVEWASNNYGVAVVNNGLVTLKGVGNARITMTSKSNSAISDYVDLISISPQIQGPDVVKDEDKATYQIQMDDSHLANEIKNKISYKWTVDDLNIANIDPNTGELTKQGQGQVSVTAQLLYDGAETDIKITKKVTLMDVVSVDITWGDMNYTFNDGKWNADTHQYDGRGWTVDQKGGDQIHIQNNGKKPINATLLYENVSAIDSKENKDSKEMINGQFLLDDQPVTDGVLISNNEKKDIRLQLQNKPKKNLNKDTIGKVTVMISQENKKE